MKTLYISDLDGTLLNSNARISDFTAQTLNSLIEKGLLFSYATARSFITAGEITKSITAHFPLILYNGTMIIDNVTKEPLITNFFDDETAKWLVQLLLENKVYPIVYHYNNNEECMAFMPEKSTADLLEFIHEYEGKLKHTPAAGEADFIRKDTYYLVCIDDEEKLYPLYQQLKDNPAVNAIYQKDFYSGRQWLEIMPSAASKAHAVQMLKEKLGCDRLVCFGDGKNDISMFNISDECYAVANAVPELKAIATGIIGTNDENAVAKWLLENGEY